MGNQTIESDGRIPIGGIKLSEELDMYTCRYSAQELSAFTDSLAAVSEKQLNIQYLCHSRHGEVFSTTFCILQEEAQEAEHCLAAFSSSTCTRQESVGTLTLFPHRNSTNLLSTITSLFHQSSLPLFSFCTSISALTLVTDYQKLDEAVSVLLQILKLPENHAPLRHEFQIRQVSL